MLNLFLNIYLRIFYTSFPPKRVINKNNNDNNDNNDKTSCRHKKELYVTYRNSNNLELKGYYQIHCKILSSAILIASLEAKIINYNAKMLKSTNKCKTTWDIIKELFSELNSKADVQECM